MKPADPRVTDVKRRSFLHRSVAMLAASAETENTYGVAEPELRSRAEVTRRAVTALATSDEVVGDAVSAEPVIWAYDRGKGRVVDLTLGHFDWTFDDPFFRTILLRGIAWAAGESPFRFDPLILRGMPLRD